jgi:hypothetical protein
VAQLYPQALGSLFVASYDSQGYGGGIRSRHHTGGTSCNIWANNIYSVRTSQRTHYVSATKPNRLMPYGEIIAVCCENHMEHVNTRKYSAGWTCCNSLCTVCTLLPPVFKVGTSEVKIDFTDPPLTMDGTRPWSGFLIFSPLPCHRPYFRWPRYSIEGLCRCYGYSSATIVERETKKLPGSVAHCMSSSVAAWTANWTLQASSVACEWIQYDLPPGSVLCEVRTELL